MCTGQDSEPRQPPNIPGRSTFTGSSMHSSLYHSGRSFANKSVLVVGFGNSGAEIALDLWEWWARPSILVRSPVHVMPRWMTQATGYLYDLVTRLPFWALDPPISALLPLIWGDMARYNMTLRDGPIVQRLVTSHKWVSEGGRGRL